MLWDTAGQEEFDAITKAYYRGKTSPLGTNITQLPRAADPPHAPPTTSGVHFDLTDFIAKSAEPFVDAHTQLKLSPVEGFKSTSLLSFFSFSFSF